MDRQPSETLPTWMLQSLLDTIPARVCWKDRESVYLGCNRLFAADAGLSSADDIVGKTDHDMPWKAQADAHRADDREVIDTGEPKLDYEESRTMADGRTAQLRKNSVPLRDEEGRITGVMCVYEDMTERRQAQESMRRSDEKYRELVENANSIILRWGRDGTIHFFNEFAQSFFGYTEEEILGRNVVGTIVPKTETSGRDLQAMMAEITAHPEYYGTNVNENMRKTGERVWIAWTNKPVFDEHGDMVELLSVGLDITTRIRDQIALEESETRYRSIFNSNVDAFVLFDAEGRIVDANARAGELYGYSRDELVGLCLNDIADPGFSHLFDGLANMAVGEWVRRESRDIRRDGTRFDVEVHGTRLRYGGKDRLLAVVFDITERKKAEEDKRQFYRKTIEAATEGKLIICDREEIEKTAGPLIAICDVSRARDVGAARRVAAEIAESQGMDESKMFDLALCVGEAATNALKHASRGTVSVHKRDGALLVLVTDSGPGMQAINLPDVALTRGYSTAVSLGMGYKAMISIADHVHLATGPGGTTVAIEMSLHSTPRLPAGVMLPDTW